ncbi:MAG: hypothetical protein WCF22_11755 [Candidatus Sulfotelmatobacter sp.]
MSFSALNCFDGAPDCFEPLGERKNSSPLLSIFSVAGGLENEGAQSKRKTKNFD